MTTITIEYDLSWDDVKYLLDQDFMDKLWYGINSGKAK